MSIAFPKIIRKLIVWFLAALAAIAFLGLFAFGILASVFYEGSNNGQLQSWVNESLNTSVQFQSASLTWRKFYPSIILNDIQIAATGNDQQTPAIVLSRAEIDINLLQSAWNLRPVAHAVILQGLQLNVVQDKNGKYSLAGFANNQGTNFSWQKVWPWLRQQEMIELLQSKLIITRNDQSQVSFDNVDMSWHRAGTNEYQLSTTADMESNTSTHLEFRAIFTGDLSQMNGFSANFYTSLQSKDFASILKHYAFYQMNLLSAGGEIKAWGSWQNSDLQRLHTIFALNNIELSNAKQGVKLDYFNENILWQRQASGGWQLLMQHQAVANINDSNDDHIFIGFSPQAQSQNWTIECSSVNIEMLSSLLHFWKEAPQHLMQAVDALDPQGQLINTTAEWSMTNNTLQTYSFNGALQNFAINSWDKIPGMSGVSANFQITSTGGTLQLTGQQAVLMPNYWFSQGWPASQLNANISWQQENDGWKVSVSQLTLHNDWLDFSGQGQVLFFAGNYKNPQIQFLAGFNLSNAQEVMGNYVPDHGIPSTLSQWLKQSFTQIPSIEGSWVWRGSLHDLPYSNHLGHFEIVANIHQASLVPWPQWPVISGVDAAFSYDGPKLLITSKSATTVNSQLSNINLNIQGIGGTSPKNLSISGDINTDGPSIKSYLLNSPMAKALGIDLSHITINGPLSGHLNMVFPLDQSHRSAISGNVNFANNQIILWRAPWIINNIQGSFSFSPSALRSEGLSASFLGDPLLIKMSSNENAGVLTQNVTMQGILNFNAMDQLAPQATFKWWKFVLGNSPFNLKVTASAKKVTVLFNSSLKGVAINLPAPFNKANNSDLPLKIEAQAEAGQLKIPVKLSLGKRLEGRLLWESVQGGLSFTKGVLVISPVSNTIKLPDSNGLLISGNFAYVAVEDWVNALKPLFKAPQASQPASTAMGTSPSYSWFNAVNLNIGYLNIYGQLFNDVDVGLAHPKQGWQISVNGPQAQGIIDLPQDWSKPNYIAHFTHFTLASSSSEKTQQTNSSKLSAQYLSKLPTMSLVIDQFTLGQQDLGSISLDMNPLLNGVNINKLAIQNQNITALIKGQITSQKIHDEVSLQGDLNGKNWGNALASFGFPGFMQDGSGPVNFQLSWQGSVTQPILPSMEGKASFNLKNGGLSKLNPGLIKLLGLFSLDSLIKHLSLNFSDMTDKGLAFDTITGDYVIHNSVASTQDFRLTGPSLDLILEGQVNLAQQTLDQTVTVIPQVGGGLALAATLIGGPVAGAATWVADKVISNTLLKDKGIVYRVTGSWNQPVVTNAS
ncbi:MAG: uncharacterized protein K0Q57_596 [Gammaproteobacteria bacterium]|nr:uncharacterized protein [Gammaproteobacteria bacterium]